jgi:glycosyltransferase involved in cell wall biosynthesis
MYKVAAYVTRCIESLENQDIDKNDYEIICINDGSPDNCKELVEGLQENYTNIVLINQENQGVSMARNNGIALAKGKYILPIDPDDYVLPQTLGKLMARVENQELDVLYLGFEIFDAEGTSSWQTDYSIQEKNSYNGVEGYFASRGKEVKDPDRSWAILYRNYLLKNYAITYPKNVPYLEDGLYVAKVCVVAQKVGFSNSKFYQRTTRKGSATNSKLLYSEKAINGFILAATELKIFASSLCLNSKQKGLINHVIIKFVLLTIMPLLSFKYANRLFKVALKLRDSHFSKLDIEGVQYGEYRKFAEFYNISILHFIFYYRFKCLKM